MKPSRRAPRRTPCRARAPREERPFPARGRPARSAPARTLAPTPAAAALLLLCAACALALALPGCGGGLRSQSPAVNLVVPPTSPLAIHVHWESSFATDWVSLQEQLSGASASGGTIIDSKGKLTLDAATTGSWDPDHGTQPTKAFSPALGDLYLVLPSGTTAAAFTITVSGLHGTVSQTKSVTIAPSGSVSVTLSPPTTNVNGVLTPQTTFAPGSTVQVTYSYTSADDGKVVQSNIAGLPTGKTLTRKEEKSGTVNVVLDHSKTYYLVVQDTKTGTYYDAVLDLAAGASDASAQFTADKTVSLGGQSVRVNLEASDYGKDASSSPVITTSAPVTATELVPGASASPTLNTADIQSGVTTRWDVTLTDTTVFTVRMAGSPDGKVVERSFVVLLQNVPGQVTIH